MWAVYCRKPWSLLTRLGVDASTAHKNGIYHDIMLIGFSANHPLPKLQGELELPLGLGRCRGFTTPQMLYGH